jgi:predicted Zn-dependent protease
MLKTNSGYSEAGEYAVAVHQIHSARAVGLLRAGRVEEAIKELKGAQRARPGDVDLVLQALPLLATARRDTEAAAFFTVAVDALERVCRDFPQAAGHHHDLARLCAGSGRKLGDAERHALAATNLEPANVAYTLTLADVYAKRGEHDKGIAVLKAASDRNPQQAELRKQLEKLIPKKAATLFVRYHSGNGNFPRSTIPL